MIIINPIYDVANLLIKKGDTPEFLKGKTSVNQLSDYEFEYLQNEVFSHPENRIVEWSTNIDQIEVIETIVQGAFKNGNIQ